MSRKSSQVMSSSSRPASFSAVWDFSGQKLSDMCRELLSDDVTVNKNSGLDVPFNEYITQDEMITCRCRRCGYGALTVDDVSPTHDVTKAFDVSKRNDGSVYGSGNDVGGNKARAQRRRSLRRSTASGVGSPKSTDTTSYQKKYKSEPITITAIIPDETTFSATNRKKIKRRQSYTTRREDDNDLQTYDYQQIELSRDQVMTPSDQIVKSCEQAMTSHDYPNESSSRGRHSKQKPLKSETSQKIFVSDVPSDNMLISDISRSSIHFSSDNYSNDCADGEEDVGAVSVGRKQKSKKLRAQNKKNSVEPVETFETSSYSEQEYQNLMNQELNYPLGIKFNRRKSGQMIRNDAFDNDENCDDCVTSDTGVNLINHRGHTYSRSLINENVFSMDTKVVSQKEPYANGNAGFIKENGGVKGKIQDRSLPQYTTVARHGNQSLKKINANPMNANEYDIGQTRENTYKKYYNGKESKSSVPGSEYCATDTFAGQTSNEYKTNNLIGHDFNNETSQTIPNRVQQIKQLFEQQSQPMRQFNGRPHPSKELEQRRQFDEPLQQRLAYERQPAQLVNGSQRSKKTIERNSQQSQSLKAQPGQQQLTNEGPQLKQLSEEEAKEQLEGQREHKHLESEQVTQQQQQQRLQLQSLQHLPQHWQQQSQQQNQNRQQRQQNQQQTNMYECEVKVNAISSYDYCTENSHAPSERRRPRDTTTTNGLNKPTLKYDVEQRRRAIGTQTSRDDLMQSNQFTVQHKKYDVVATHLTDIQTPREAQLRHVTEELLLDIGQRLPVDRYIPLDDVTVCDVTERRRPRNSTALSDAVNTNDYRDYVTESQLLEADIIRPDESPREAAWKTCTDTPPTIISPTNYTYTDTPLSVSPLESDWIPDNTPPNISSPTGLLPISLEFITSQQSNHVALGLDYRRVHGLDLNSASQLNNNYLTSSSSSLTRYSGIAEHNDDVIVPKNVGVQNSLENNCMKSALIGEERIPEIYDHHVNMCNDRVNFETDVNEIASINLAAPLLPESDQAILEEDIDCLVPSEDMNFTTPVDKSGGVSLKRDRKGSTHNVATESVSTASMVPGCDDSPCIHSTSGTDLRIESSSVTINESPATAVQVPQRDIGSARPTRQRASTPSRDALLLPLSTYQEASASMTSFSDINSDKQNHDGDWKRNMKSSRSENTLYHRTRDGFWTRCDAEPEETNMKLEPGTRDTRAMRRGSTGQRGRSIGPASLSVWDGRRSERGINRSNDGSPVSRRNGRLAGSPGSPRNRRGRRFVKSPAGSPSQSPERSRQRRRRALSREWSVVRVTTSVETVIISRSTSHTQLTSNEEKIIDRSAAHRVGNALVAAEIELEDPPGMLTTSKDSETEKSEDIKIRQQAHINNGNKEDKDDGETKDTNQNGHNVDENEHLEARAIGKDSNISGNNDHVSSDDDQNDNDNDNDNEGNNTEDEDDNMNDDNNENHDDDDKNSNSDNSGNDKQNDNNSFEDTSSMTGDDNSNNNRSVHENENSNNNRNDSEGNNEGDGSMVDDEEDDEDDEADIEVAANVTANEADIEADTNVSSDICGAQMGDSNEPSDNGVLDDQLYWSEDTARADDQTRSHLVSEDFSYPGSEGHLNETFDRSNNDWEETSGFMSDVPPSEYTTNIDTSQQCEHSTPHKPIHEYCANYSPDPPNCEIPLGEHLINHALFRGYSNNNNLPDQCFVSNTVTGGYSADETSLGEFTDQNTNNANTNETDLTTCFDTDNHYQRINTGETEIDISDDVSNSSSNATSDDVAFDWNKNSNKTDVSDSEGTDENETRYPMTSRAVEDDMMIYAMTSHDDEHIAEIQDYEEERLADRDNEYKMDEGPEQEANGNFSGLQFESVWSERSDQAQRCIESFHPFEFEEPDKTVATRQTSSGGENSGSPVESYRASSARGSRRSVPLLFDIFRFNVLIPNAEDEGGSPVDPVGDGLNSLLGRLDPRLATLDTGTPLFTTSATLSPLFLSQSHNTSFYAPQSRQMSEPLGASWHGSITNSQDNYVYELQLLLDDDSRTELDTVPVTTAPSEHLTSRVHSLEVFNRPGSDWEMNQQEPRTEQNIETSSDLQNAACPLVCDSVVVHEYAELYWFYKEAMITVRATSSVTPRTFTRTSSVISQTSRGQTLSVGTQTGRAASFDGSASGTETPLVADDTAGYRTTIITDPMGRRIGEGNAGHVTVLVRRLPPHPSTTWTWNDHVTRRTRNGVTSSDHVAHLDDVVSLTCTPAQISTDRFTAVVENSLERHDLL